MMAKNETSYRTEELPKKKKKGENSVKSEKGSQEVKNKIKYSRSLNIP